MKMKEKDYLKENKDFIDSLVNNLVDVYGIEVEPCISEAVELSFLHGYNTALDKVARIFTETD